MRTIHFLLRFIFLLFIFKPVWAQKNKDHEQIKKLIKKARKFTSKDSSIYFINKAVKIAQNLQNDSILIDTYYNKPLLFAIRGNFDLTLKYLKEFDSLLQIKYHYYYDFRRNTLYAYTYSMKSMQDESLMYNQNSLRLAIKHNDSVMMAEAYNNIGTEFRNLDKDSIALEYYKKSYGIYKKLKIKPTATLLNNMSQAADNYEEAVKYSNEAYQIISKSKEKYKLALFYLIRSDMLFNLNRFDESLQAADQSFNLSDSIHYIALKNDALILMGKNNYELKRYKLAGIQLLQSLKQKTSPTNRAETYKTLSLSFEKQNNYPKAHYYLKKYLILEDSLRRIENEKGYNELNIKYKTAEKNKELIQQKLELKNQKIRNNRKLMIIIIFFFITIGFFQWLFYRQKKKKSLLEMQLTKEKEINQIRKDLLGNIAHEIRTPLSLITGNLELALENIAIRKKVRFFINESLNNVKKVLNDTNEMLRLFKYNDSTPKINISRINLFESLNRIVYSYKSLMQLKGIKLIFDNKVSKNIIVETDIDKVEKIINNLISNAIKFAPSKSPIDISAKTEDNHLIFSVKDYGIGIQQNELSKIFDRFYQSENHKTGGIGLGLAIAREFSNLLQGLLTVESNQGKFTIFTFKMPLKIVNETELTVKTSFESRHAKNYLNIFENKPIEKNKKNILIVEDNPEMNKYLSNILCCHFNCYHAFNGQEAVEILNKFKIDLITTDIMMPQMDGFELLKYIKQHEKLSHISIIFVSAKFLEEDKINALNLGIDDYIVKPFNKKELLARINNILQNRLNMEKWLFKEKALLKDDENKKYDDEVLQRIKTIIMVNLTNEKFKISDIAKQIGYSQRQLNRILKKNTGMSPIKYILEIRLQKAYVLLKTKRYPTLSDVMYEVGINSSNYFNKKFFERFGIYPRDI